MKYFSKLTVSLTLVSLLAVAAVTAAHAQGCKSEATILYEAALHMRCNSNDVGYRSGKSAADGCEGKKTVAAIRTTNGQIQYFMSGWAEVGNTETSITQIDPEKTIAWAKTFGHTFEKDDYLDQGIDGQYYASHTEAHALSQQKNRLYQIGVSSPLGTMCPKCRDLYRTFVKNQIDHDIIVVTKNWSYYFYHDGRKPKKNSRK